MLNTFIKKLPRRELIFLIGFAAIYSILHAAYFMVPDRILREAVYYYGIVSVSASVINVMTPAENVKAEDNKLQSPKAILEVVRGCDGSGSIFLMIAAIVAFSATLKNKLLGVLVGFSLLYIINQIRIIGLYFVVAYHREWFLPIHTYFAPTLIILISCLFFAWWAMMANEPSASQQA